MKYLSDTQGHHSHQEFGNAVTFDIYFEGDIFMKYALG